MRRIFKNALLCAVMASVPGAALAAGREPVVLRGYGPQDAALDQRAAPQPARPNLGGGFIEMLVRGPQSNNSLTARYNEPTAAPVYATTYAPEAAPAPGRAERQAYYAAPPLNAGVRRTLDPVFQRQEVAYDGRERAGTIVIDTPRRFLFLVLGNGRALRYGIGVGRPGFEWAGVKTVSRKAEWPDWRPPAEMLKRRPDLPTFMPGGPENPLGARALYLGSSLYRIHGTNEPFTIGQNVSSGCIRLMNDDVVDLYNRVRVGAKVIVI